MGGAISISASLSVFSQYCFKRCQRSYEEKDIAVAVDVGEEQSFQFAEPVKQRLDLPEFDHEGFPKVERQRTLSGSFPQMLRKRTLTPNGYVSLPPEYEQVRESDV